MVSLPDVQWVDVLDDGVPYTRNSCEIVDSDAAFTEQMRDLPHGFGCSFVNLGKQPEFVEALLGGALDGHEIAKSMANSILDGAPRTLRVQVGLSDDPSLPALEDQPSNREVSIAVWGHDPAQLADTRASVSEAMALATESGGVYKVSDFLNSKMTVAARNASQLYRQKIAKKMLGVLASECEVDPPESVLSADADAVYPTHEFDLVHFTPCVGNQVAVSVDANVGNEAVLYHSPEQGFDLFLSDELPTNKIANAKALQFTPGSSGRTVSFAGGDNATNSATNIANAASQTASSEVRTVHKVAVNANAFQSIETDGSTYRDSLPLQHTAAVAKACTQVCKVKTIATALPPVQHANGMLHGTVECSSLQDVLRFTPRFASHVIVPNTSEWRQALTAADAHQRPAALMNDSSELVDASTGQVVAWKVRRSDLEPEPLQKDKLN